MAAFPGRAAPPVATRPPAHCMCWVCIPQSQVGILESLGKFARVLPPGINCINPCTHALSGNVSLRVDTLETLVNSVTKDQTSVRLQVRIIRRVIPSLVHMAYYSLSAATQQVQSYVISVVRAATVQHSMDELFVIRQEIAFQLKEELTSQLARYGYEILDVLILDIDPRDDIKEAMNQQMVRAYQREANAHKAELEKISTVKKAEADAECKRLEGVGAAEQQKAISSSFEIGFTMAQGQKKAASESEIMAMILMQQYFTVLDDISKNSAIRPLSVFLPARQKKMQ